MRPGVQVQWIEKGQVYAGTIVRVKGDGTYEAVRSLNPSPTTYATIKADVALKVHNGRLTADWRVPISSVYQEQFDRMRRA